MPPPPCPNTPGLKSFKRISTNTANQGAGEEWAADIGLSCEPVDTFHQGRSDKWEA